jgi:hypothetical protein
MKSNDIRRMAPKDSATDDLSAGTCCSLATSAARRIQPDPRRPSRAGAWRFATYTTIAAFQFGDGAHIVKIL